MRVKHTRGRLFDKLAVLMRTHAPDPACARPWAGLVLLLVTAGSLWSDVAGPAVQVPTKGGSPIIDRVRTRGALRAGVNVALPWLGQNPKTGEFYGPSVELGQEIARLLGVNMELIPSASDVIIAGIQANQFDLAIAPLYATDRRRQVVDFVTYAVAGHCYAVRKDNPRINSLEDLNQPSVTVGLWTGTGSDRPFRQKYPSATINAVPMPVGGVTRMEEVMAGRIDVATLDSARALLVDRQFPQLKILPGGPENCMKNPDIPTPLGMALPKGDPEFKKFLEAVVASIQTQLNASIVKHSSLESMLSAK